MKCRYICLFWLCLPSLSIASVDNPRVDEKDLYLGEAFYYAFQGKYVDAITRQDIAFGKLYGPATPDFDSLHFQFGYSQFTLGDFELSYRMHRRAERTFSTIAEGKADQLVRNEAAYRLARIYMQRDEPDNAQKSMEKITGEIPVDIVDDVLFLRAQIYMANGKFLDAVKPLQELKNSKEYKGFADYNLGVALVKSGQRRQGLDQLVKAGEVSGDDEDISSIQDKTNLSLGYLMMDDKQPALARQYFERVRLDGPFSNKALLGAGWAEVSLGKLENALAPWSVLSKRKASDNSVQESMLGVPYVYAQLNLPAKATLLYGQALERFDMELTRLDTSIKSVKAGKLLSALLQEELKQDGDWFAILMSLPEAPETRYLPEMMRFGDFQETLKNYRDLDDLSKSLETWGDTLNAYEEIIVLRRKYYEALLPDIDKKYLAQNAKIKLLQKQRKSLDEKYGSRLADAYKRLKQVDDDIHRARQVHASLLSQREYVTQSYQGYDDQLRQLKSRVHDSRRKVNVLLSQHGRVLETMAINALNQKRKHLQENQAQAKLAFVENYERAKMQTLKSGVK